MGKAPKTQSRAPLAVCPRVFALACLLAAATVQSAGAQPPPAGAPIPLVTAIPVLVAPPPNSPPTAADEYAIGQAYDAGTGVPQDFALAFYWYCQSARQGYAPAQLAVSRYYARGVAVPRDLIRAYVWANLAASQLPSGTLERRSALQFRDYVRFKLDVRQLAFAQQLATGWPPLPR